MQYYRLFSGHCIRRGRGFSPGKELYISIQMEKNSNVSFTHKLKVCVDSFLCEITHSSERALQFGLFNGTIVSSDKILEMTGDTLACSKHWNTSIIFLEIVNWPH